LFLKEKKGRIIINNKLETGTSNKNKVELTAKMPSKNKKNKNFAGSKKVNLADFLADTTGNAPNLVKTKVDCGEDDEEVSTKAFDRSCLPSAPKSDR
jgi:hypothetical protein